MIAERDNDAALASLEARQAAVDAVFFEVGGADVPAHVATVDRRCSVNFGGAGFARDSFADFMREDESRFILNAKIAGELQRGKAFGGVREDADRAQKVHEREFPAGEDRSGRDRKLLAAGAAFELAARFDFISLGAAAGRANGLAAGFRPADGAEGFVSLFLACDVNILEFQGLGGGGK